MCNILHIPGIFAAEKLSRECKLLVSSRFQYESIEGVITTFFRLPECYFTLKKMTMKRRTNKVSTRESTQ